MIRTRHLLAVAALLLLATGAAAQPEPTFHVPVDHWGLGPGPTGKHLASALGLTAEQQTAVRDLSKEIAAQARPLMEQHRGEMAAIHALLDAGGADPTEVGERMIAADETRRRLRAVHEDFLARVSALLTAEQLATFQELRATHLERGSGFAFHHR